MTTEVPAAAAFAPLSLGDQEFAALQALVYAEAGIFLSQAKRALVSGRLSRRVRELGLTSFAAYHAYATREDPHELVHLLDRITTNETHFFREPGQFRVITERLVPAWLAQADAGLRPRRLRAWSAACSSGEEPYSLAMVLLEHCPGWTVEIVASDLSSRALARARAAQWPIAKAEEIPAPYLKRFMLRGLRSQAGQMRAAPELRDVVRFERLNLHTDAYPAGDGFDLILCRNVLIYFDAASKTRVLDRLLERLAPGGHLFLGHAESLGRTTLPMRGVSPNVYARVEAAA